jgi:type IV pilus biogenesis protein CpaD/CtpE
MTVRMVLGVGVAVGLSACAPRQVEVRTAPAQQTQVAVLVTNNLSQAVNVYVTSGGSDTFLRQVAAHTSVTVPVQNFAPGSSVSLKAVTVDGVHTYTRNDVTLSGTYSFTLP